MSTQILISFGFDFLEHKYNWWGPQRVQWCRQFPVVLACFLLAWNVMWRYDCTSGPTDSSTCMRTGSPLYSPIKQVFEEVWTLSGKFDCTYSFDEIQLLWCYPAEDGPRRTLCHVECLFWWKVITSYTDIGLEAYWTYTGKPWHLSSTVEASPLDHQSPSCSKQSPLPMNLPLCGSNVSIILTWKIGLAGWGSCAPVLKVYSSLLSFQL